MLLLGLASNGVYMCPVCYQPGGSLLHCLSTLTRKILAVYFCCTGLGVTSTGRYPASCPVKPGLSSPDIHQPRLPVLLAVSIFYPTEIPLSSAERIEDFPPIPSVLFGSAPFLHVLQTRSQTQPIIRQTTPPLRSRPTRNAAW